MFRNKTFKILIAVIVIQIAVFSSMIVYSFNFNKEIQKSKEYIMLVDLYYLQNGKISFSTRATENEIVLASYDDDYKYVTIGVDENGSAVFGDCVNNKPENTEYMEMIEQNVKKFRKYEAKIDKSISYGFNNILLEDPYIKFRVKNGKVVVTEMGIAGIPIEEWIEEPVTKYIPPTTDDPNLLEDKIVY